MKPTLTPALAARLARSTSRWYMVAALMITCVIVLASSGVALVQAQAQPTATPVTPTAAATEPAPTGAASATALPPTQTPFVCPELPRLTATDQAGEATAEATAEGAAITATRTAVVSATSTAYLGVAVEDSTNGCGVVVVDLDPRGPAQAAGVRIGDVIYGAASLETPTPLILRGLIQSLPPGSAVTLYILRRGEPITVLVTLVDANAALTATPTTAPTSTKTMTATAIDAAEEETPAATQEPAAAAPSTASAATATPTR